VSSRRDGERDKIIEGLQQEIQNYEETVQVTFAFGHEARWDPGREALRPGAIFLQGQRLVTSAANPVAPETPVTPDVLVCLSPEYGILGETKKSFPDNQALWDSDFQELQRYDDELHGWPTDTRCIGKHDLALLVHNSRKVAVSDGLAAKIAAGEVAYRRALAVVAFHRVSEVHEHISLERHWGAFSDKALDERLRLVRQIAMRHLIRAYYMRFSDADPPVPYTTAVIWTDVLPGLPSVDEYVEDRARRRRMPIVTVTVRQATEVLQQRHAANNPDLAGVDARTVPRSRWVRRGLDALVDYGYAKRAAQRDTYVVRLQRLRADPIVRFIQKEATQELKGRAKSRAKQKREDESGQLRLPEPD